METKPAQTPEQPATGKSRVRKLSILIPVYNEIRTLERLLTRVQEAPLPCDRELVIVDDCSKDGSREFLKSYRKQQDNVRVILHKKNGGKGAAIRTAIAHMTGDWAIIQDADLEYDPNDYQALLVPVEDGIADAVFGSRFLTGRYRRAMFFWHTMANKFLTLSSNVLNDLNLTDMETCYKLIRADILKHLVIRSKGFDLEPELTAKLARWGARIYEVPIAYRGRTYAEGKKIGPMDAVHAIRAMLRYRFFDHQYTRHAGFIILQSIRRARKFNGWLMSQVEDYLGDEVLEAGSGIGNLTDFLLDKERLVCLDYEDFYVERLRQSFSHLGNFEVRQADLTKQEDLVEAANGKPFDSVLCINVMEHIEQDLTVLRNFYEVLKPGGYAVILVPHDPDLYSPIDKELGHFLRYSKKHLADRLKEAGFEVVETKGFNRVGGLGWRISGKIMRRNSISTGQMRLFEMGMPIIRQLEKIPFHSHNSVIGVGRKPE
ncbi:glycosyltransferase [bacterium]|nr:glycosyltransferase [bacterium]